MNENNESIISFLHRCRAEIIQLILEDHHQNQRKPQAVNAHLLALGTSRACSKRLSRAHHYFSIDIRLGLTRHSLPRTF